VNPPSITTTAVTRLSLLERARLQDQLAWTELVDLYSPLIVRWCNRSRLSHESTADIIQDVFASVARSLDTYHANGSDGAFRGWLWTITRNKLHDAARRNQLRMAPTGGSSALAKLNEVVEAVEFLSDEPSLAEDIQSLARRALKLIEPSFAAQTWQAFWRSVIDGVATDVVATELGVTPAAVRQSRSRILRRLREQLGDAK
jgi:RNA polymerase sigma-70 factor, ECF subfamily